jgi:hypothetical protein
MIELYRQKIPNSYLFGALLLQPFFRNGKSIYQNLNDFGITNIHFNSNDIDPFCILHNHLIVSLDGGKKSQEFIRQSEKHDVFLEKVSNKAIIIEIPTHLSNVIKHIKNQEFSKLNGDLLKPAKDCYVSRYVFSVIKKDRELVDAIDEYYGITNSPTGIKELHKYPTNYDTQTDDSVVDYNLINNSLKSFYERYTQVFA